MGESVKLVGITVPVLEELSPTATAQDLLIYIARVSNPSNQLNLDTGDKLLRYLYRKRHWSPFEMVSLTMEFNTTRDIGRQILRHRSFSFQEFSQRYADPTKELGFELREARLQDNKNRQNSIETDDEQLQLEWQDRQEDIIRMATDTYKWAIETGVAKEQARVVLPEGLTKSRMYMQGTLRSWIHYAMARNEQYIDEKTGLLVSGTQKEHRQLSLEAEAILLKHFPALSGVLKTS